MSEPKQRARGPLTGEVALHLGTVIRKRRLLLGLKQVEFAARIGTRRSLVCRVESGIHVVTLETAERYARALGCKVSTLVQEAEALAEGGSSELPREVAV
jgi:transcriptional regulator with XRE-family HTH domain